MAVLGLAAGSETNAAHIKDLMLVSHRFSPGQPLYRPASKRPTLTLQCPDMIQQAGVEGKERKRRFGLG
jgi:hypothetical protein